MPDDPTKTALSVDKALEAIAVIQQSFNMHNNTHPVYMGFIFYFYTVKSYIQIKE